MTYTTANPGSETLKKLQSLDTDQQLALFWFIYTEMGESITPAAPSASTVSPTIAEGLFNQVKELSREAQLQVQRDLIEQRDTDFTREYGAIGDTTKLLFWYLLAQGMSNGTVVPYPNDYKLSQEAEQLFSQIKGMEFNEQITLFRDYVSPMGTDSTGADRQ